MNEEMFKEAMERVDTLAAKMGVAATELWEILVRQQYIEAIEIIMSCLFMVGVSVFGCKVLMNKKWLNWDYMEDHNLEPLCIIAYTVVCIWVILTIISICCLFDVPGNLLNPEYGAYMAIRGGGSCP